MKRQKNESFFLRVLKYAFCRCTMRVNHHDSSEEDAEANKPSDTTHAELNSKSLKGGDDVIMSGTGYPLAVSEMTKINNFSPER
jgi:hypothetical protein